MSYRLRRRLFQAAMILPLFLLLIVRWMGQLAEEQLLWLLQTEMHLAFREYQALSTQARKETPHADDPPPPPAEV